VRRNKRAAAIVASALVAAVLTTALAAAAPSPSPSASTSPPPAPAIVRTNSDALVRTALDATKHVSYVGQLETTRWGTSAASATIQRVEHLAPSQTRRTYLAPEDLYCEFSVTDGTTTRKFDPRHSRVLVTDSPSGNRRATGPNGNVALLEQNYRAVLGPVDMVAGRPATTVWLVNRYTGVRAMRLWIDNGTKVVLSKEAYHADGSLAWRMRFDEIRFTAEIPRDIFSTSVPIGFQVMDRRFNEMSTDMQRMIDEAGFKSVGPRYLPDGFNIVGTDVSQVNGVRNLHFVYSDGVRTVSLFENNVGAEADFGTLKPSVTRFDGHDAHYVKDGPTTLLSWHDRGLAFALVGDLDVRELIQIATSVGP
jgi:outer membrane lipoprotein-sorting protein